MRPSEGTVVWLLRRYVAGRTDITEKAREQYAWAATHIESGLGAIPLARLDRDDVAELDRGPRRWRDSTRRRSVQICRNVLRAALDRRRRRRPPPAQPRRPRRPPEPVAKPVKVKDAVAWSRAEVDRFLEVDRRAPMGDRVPSRRAVRPATKRGARAAMGRRRHDERRRCGSTRASSPSTTAPRGATPRTNDRDASSRSTTQTLRALSKRRAEQAAERLAAGAEWDDTDLIITTRQGGLVLPRSYDRALALDRPRRRASEPDIARPPPHRGHPHGRTASDLGELRAIADILGHSPEMLLNVYSHALPRSQSAVVDRISRRSS